MARFRSLHRAAVYVPLIGRTVQPGDVIDVPDELVSVTGEGPGCFFAPENWKTVTPPSRRRTATGPAAATTTTPREG